MLLPSDVPRISMRDKGGSVHASTPLPLFRWAEDEMLELQMAVRYRHGGYGLTGALRTMAPGTQGERKPDCFGWLVRVKFPRDAPSAGTAAYPQTASVRGRCC